MAEDFIKVFYYRLHTNIKFYMIEKKKSYKTETKCLLTDKIQENFQLKFCNTYKNPSII